MELRNKGFVRLKKFMYNNYRIKLENKKTLIETQLVLMGKCLGLADFKRYMDSLIQDKTGEQGSILVEKLTTNFTYFMPDKKLKEYMNHLNQEDI
ncbi:hypothetical protein [Romboutsia sp.]|uniref:hypothetical protein n=1 Tax=Romboutsia sp. TaxID=1965302 RepID=UPI002B8976E4|nr:hypothetical protein [Romboutsia sp.]HSQ87262.1 hypothetical protein [Romboutsia sp.]